MVHPWIPGLPWFPGSLLMSFVVYRGAKNIQHFRWSPWFMDSKHTFFAPRRPGVFQCMIGQRKLQHTDPAVGQLDHEYAQLGRRYVLCFGILDGQLQAKTTNRTVNAKTKYTWTGHLQKKNECKCPINQAAFGIWWPSQTSLQSLGFSPLGHNCQSTGFNGERTQKWTGCQ